MYFPYFISYMAIGFGISLLVFWWALTHGQFRDQERARYLPLDEDAESPVCVTRFNRWEGYGLVILALAGLAASAAVLIFSAAA